jgi:hypothetical protein
MRTKSEITAKAFSPGSRQPIYEKSWGSTWLDAKWIVQAIIAAGWAVQRRRECWGMGRSRMRSSSIDAGLEGQARFGFASVGMAQVSGPFGANVHRWSSQSRVRRRHINQLECKWDFMLRNKQNKGNNIHQDSDWVISKGFKCQTKILESYPVSSKDPMKWAMKDCILRELIRQWFAEWIRRETHK